MSIRRTGEDHRSEAHELSSREAGGGSLRRRVRLGAGGRSAADRGRDAARPRGLSGGRQGRDAGTWAVRVRRIGRGLLHVPTVISAVDAEQVVGCLTGAEGAAN